MGNDIGSGRGICFDLPFNQRRQLSNQGGLKTNTFYIILLDASICRFLYIENFPKKNSMW